MKKESTKVVLAQDTSGADFDCPLDAFVSF